MTTILLNFHNAGFFPLDSMILAMGIFYGGLAQVVAGIMEWKKGNTFAATAFISYGTFWLSLVALVVLPKAGLGVAGPSGLAMPVYLAIWGLFTAVLFIGTLRLNRALQVVFGSLTLLFVLLAIGDAEGNAAIGQLAGWVGLFCCASAVYTGLAQVLH
jgi:succinate-acetate transporter protein